MHNKVHCHTYSRTTTTTTTTTATIIVILASCVPVPGRPRQFSISFRTRWEKNKRDFERNGEWIEADMPRRMYFSPESATWSCIAILLAEILGFSDVHSLRRERSRGNATSGEAVSCPGSMLNMPPTRDLGVKVEEPVAPEFGFLHRNELSIRLPLAPPRSADPPYNYLLPTFPWIKLCEYFAGGTVR